MTEPIDGGSSVRDQLESLADKIENPRLQVRGRDVSLSPPDVDMGEHQQRGAILYTIFLELSKHRAKTQGGVCPITWQDLYAWMQLNQTELNTQDVDVIMHLDNVFCNEVTERLNAEYDKIRAQ